MKNKGKWTKRDYEAISGTVLGANADIFSNAIEGLRNFSDLPVADKDKKLDQLVKIFDEHKASGANAVSQMPTKVMEATINRMENQVLADTIAEQYCVIDTVAPGETIHYKTKTRDTFDVTFIGEMGGKPVNLRMGGKETNASLGVPTIYTTDDFAIPTWDMYHPKRYLEEVEDLSVWAGMDLTSKIDTDIWTTLDAQIAATWTQSSVFTYVDDRVQDLPTGNSLNVSASSDGADKFTLESFQDTAMHGLRMGRKLKEVLIPTLIWKDFWNWVHYVASSQGFSNLSEAYKSELERTGGQVIDVYGMGPVRIRSTNIFDGNGTNVYGRAFYDPVEPWTRTAPRGCAYLYWQQVDPNQLENIVVWMRREKQAGAGVVDIFSIQKSLLITSVSFQKPNLAKLQIVSA